MTGWRCLLVVLVVVLTKSGVDGNTGSCAKMVLFDSKSTTLYNQDIQKYITETKITFELGLKETVCFKVLDKNGGVTDRDVDGKTFYLTFEDVQQIFTYKNSYEFSMAEVVAKCVCDCPGLEDHCSPKRDSCAEDNNNDKTCFKYYADDQSTDGCGILSSIGNGEVCCSVSIAPWEKTLYTAIEISTPATKARFRFEESKPYTSSQHNVDLDSAAKFFVNKLTVSFANPGKSNPIPADWYYGAKDSNEVLTNVDVNGLDEWDLDKMGWYKYNEGKYDLDNTLVQKAFSGTVTDCDDSLMDITFASKFNSREVTEAKTLSEFYKSSVENAVRDDDIRNVYIEFRSFSRVSVMISLGGEKEVIQQFSMPSYLDYFGTVLLDKYSNRFINITIVSGRGTLYGTLVIKVTENKKSVNKEVENFEVIVPNQADVTSYNFTKYILITSPCSADSTAQLCIHTGSKNEQECKVIMCSEEPLEDFALPESIIEYEKGRKDSLLSPSTWLKYLNPLEWFNGITGMQEGVVMAVGIVGFIILMCILIKLCHCLNCLFKILTCCFRLPCLKKHKKKVEEHAHKINTKPDHHVKRKGGKRKRRSYSCTSSNVSSSSISSDKFAKKSTIKRKPLSRKRMGGSIRSAGSSFKNSFKQKTQNMSDQTYVLLQRLLNTPQTRDETMRALRNMDRTSSQDDLERHPDIRECIPYKDECFVDGRGRSPPPPYEHRSTRRNKRSRGRDTRSRSRSRDRYDDYFDDKRKRDHSTRSTKSNKSAKNKRTRSREDISDSRDNRGHRPSYPDVLSDRSYSPDSDRRVPHHSQRDKRSRSRSRTPDIRNLTMDTYLDSTLDSRNRTMDTFVGNTMDSDKRDRRDRKTDKRDWPSDKKDRTMDNRRSGRGRDKKSRRGNNKSGYETDTSNSQSTSSLERYKKANGRRHSSYTGSSSSSISSETDSPHINLHIPLTEPSDSDILSTDTELKPGVSEIVVPASTPVPRTPIMTTSLARH